MGGWAMAAHVNERSYDTAAGTKLCRACVDFKTWTKQQTAKFTEVILLP
jgi:hypothetical protein